jgi:hypothetical protein
MLLHAGKKKFWTHGLILSDKAASGGGGGFSLVAHTIATNGSASPITTSAIDTTGATLIVVAFDEVDGLALATVSDNKGNTWTPLTARDNGAGPLTQLVYCIAPTVGSGHTFTITSTSTFISGHLAVQAWSGGAGTFDVQNGGTPAFGTSAQPGSVTPSVNNSLIITSVSADNDSALPLTINSGFTVSDTSRTDGAYLFGMAYFVQGTAAAINPTWSWAGTGSDIAAAIATFKP